MQTPQSTGSLDSSPVVLLDRYIHSSIWGAFWPQKLRLISFIALSMSVWGCPSDITAIDLGMSEMDQMPSGSEGGGEIARGACIEDTQCMRDEYCLLSDEMLEGQCVFFAELQTGICAREVLR